MNKKEQNNPTIFSDQFNLIVSFNQLEKIATLKSLMIEGVSLFELRADLLDDHQFQSIDSWLDQAQIAAIPILFTLRNKQQGGAFEGTEEQRFNQIKKFLSHRAIAAIDIEQNCQIAKEVIERAGLNNKTIFISNHFFDQSPSIGEMNQLIEKFDQMKQSQTDIFKLAINLQSLDDYKKASDFLIQTSNNHQILLVGMGQFSLLSRVSFPALGSVASFCHLSESTAPNQPSFETLVKLKSILY